MKKGESLRVGLLMQTIVLFVISFVLAYATTFPAAGAVTRESIFETVATHQNPWVFLLMFAVVSVVALLLVKYLTSEKFWTMFFGMGAFAGLFTIFSYLCIHFLSVTTSFIVAFVLSILCIVARAKTKIVWIHNLLIVVAVAGIARILAWQFSPGSTGFILVVISIYDLIAVFWTKHMVSLAKSLFEYHAFFGIILPEKLDEWKKSFTEFEVGKNVVVIGAGDIAFPLFFALSNLFYRGEQEFWLITAAVLLGVVLMHLIYILPKKSRPIPAMPPLVLCSFIGYALTLL